jgi:hypothetical protein
MTLFLFLALENRRSFSKKTIIRNFDSLMDKEEYARSEKKEIIEFLMELSKGG